ncbi:integrase [Streptosporangium sp. V21-05]|uniref:integrase n=1 Tax=Streptosporangium sp. V21-05 TaxID=3446115 RepID=UPI003F532F37
MPLGFATEPAHPDQPNEDFVGATPEAAILLDGAGTPAGLKIGCSHGVAWYAHTLGSTLLAAMTQSTGTLTQLLAEGIKTVASLHDFTCDLAHAGSPSATVVMLRRTTNTLEWLVLADSLLLLDIFGAEPLVVCDDREALTGERYRGPLNTALAGTAAHVQARSDYVTAMRGHRNVDGGFWVASVDPLAADQALTGSISIKRVRAAALLSDGASRLVDRFALASWRQTLDTLDDAGPDELIRQVRHAEHADLDASRWPRSKVHDDASAIFWKFS